MIYVSVGLSIFSFNRLFRILDELCKDGTLDGKLILGQTGKMEYVPKTYSVCETYSYEIQQKNIMEADIIISHAGTGTLINCLEKEKKVIIFPRLTRFKEHVDDHQLEIADFFSKEGYALYAESKESLVAALNQINAFVPRKFLSNKHHFNQILMEYIEK